MQRLIFIITCLLGLAGVSTAQQNEFIPGKVILKIKEQYVSINTIGGSEGAKLQSVLSSIGATTVLQKFPSHKNITAARSINKNLVDLSLIYEVNYTSSLDPVKVSALLSSTGCLEYAQPHFIPVPFYTPNDPLASSQYHLAIIDAYQAWNISQGDTNVVIGISDTGIDIDHEDLVGNIKYNYLDPIDGADNDGDGYVDNFRGWDLGEMDNDPQSNANHHGVHVAGLAAATTDNGKGIAASGFRCKLMPIKIANAAGALTVSYESIVYAADHGCSIVNCSWGGGGGGQYGQDIINYATFNQDVLVVAAAGNDGNNVPFYPASYMNVLNVAASTEIDTKWPQSSYGATVDITAPGYNVTSTWNGDLYISSSGTSMASPVAAGCAAVVRSYFPSYSALQAGERLRVTSDNIDANNPGLEKDLGEGRVNLFKALTQAATPSVRVNRKTLSDNNDNAFEGADTVRVRGTFINFLAPASNIEIRLTSLSPFVTVLDSVFMAGTMSTMDSVNNNNDPFLVKILNTAPLNEPVKLMFTYRDGASYQGFECFMVTVNVDYINITINDVLTTITSKGKIGYNQDNQQEGLGFDYNGNNLLYEAGLLIGENVGQVSDAVRGTGGAIDQDFEPVLNVHRIIPSVVSDFDLEGIFNDNAAGAAQLDVEVKHQAFAWSTPNDVKYIILRYVIKNNSNNVYDSLYAGIFADWDINNASQNKADYDAANRLGYIYDQSPNNVFAGIKVLNTIPAAINCAIDNVGGGAGGIDISNGFSTAEKFIALKTMRTSAGVGATGNDVAHVVSVGPFNLLPNDTVVAAFALLAGDDLPDLQASAVNAQSKYDSAFPMNVTQVGGDKVLFFPLYPNPATDRLNMEFYIPDTMMVEMKMFSVTGQLVQSENYGSLSPGKYRKLMDISGLSSGAYFYKLKIGDSEVNSPVIVHKR